MCQAWINPLNGIHFSYCIAYQVRLTFHITTPYGVTSWPVRNTTQIIPKKKPWSIFLSLSDFFKKKLIKSRAPSSIKLVSTLNTLHEAIRSSIPAPFPPKSQGPGSVQARPDRTRPGLCFSFFSAHSQFTFLTQGLKMVPDMDIGEGRIMPCWDHYYQPCRYLNANTKTWNVSRQDRE